MRNTRSIVADAEALLSRVFPECRVGRVVADGGSTVVLWVYHRHLSCLFPQHGPGKKHQRPIELEPWQYDLVGSAPWAFVRGCIRSDGCSFINRTGRYAYLSFEFRNWSTDILGIFAATCAAARPASPPVRRSCPALPPGGRRRADDPRGGKILMGRATLLVRKRLW